MDKRAFLAVILCLLVLVLWQAFFAPKPPPPAAKKGPAAEKVAKRAPVPKEEKVAPQASPRVDNARMAPPGLPAAAKQTSRDITVETPLYRAVFTETGGRLKSYTLKRYRETIAKDSPGMQLVRNQKIEELPLAFNFLSHPVAALNLAHFSADQTTLKISEEGKPKKLTFTYEAPGWLRIVREYLFHPDSYLIELNIAVTNLGSQPWEDSPTLSLVNVPFSEKAGRYSFQGPALLVDNKLDEIKVKKIEGEKVIPGPVEWVAYTNQYFIMAVVPQEQAPNHALLKILEPATHMVESTFVGPKSLIQPGASKSFHYTLYMGPKDVKTLKAANLKLEKAVNFGWFDVIAQPLLVCLKFFNRFTHNYGVAIILLTILIKVLFWPLTRKSYESMQAMKKLQPKMAKIREKYKDDKERMNQEIMQLYRTHKVNPLGGCLPMVLQIPVFFALYRVLYSSIALRHAPFMLWINDLSAPDRLNIGFQIPYLGGLPVLTLLMGVSMFVQQKMTPTTGDPRQEKMMLMMPVVFTFLFVNFPSGLVLYWLVNNILQIGQQYFINKKAQT
ncbi:MAG: membrane protein insertase YidC [Deltaproteobacteria bacterium]|nr:membrane protein insertase YidC [Deltaproteobacteria bacterium]MBW2070868.1 membrane protein insertase YidC [Deltaproteobacteria bacterium]